MKRENNNAPQKPFHKEYAKLKKKKKMLSEKRLYLHCIPKLKDMKKVLLITTIWLLAFGAQAQITGHWYIPSDTFPTIQSAFDSLNARGVGPGGVTFHIRGGHVENITAPLQLTATGTASNPISFLWDGTGSKPQIIRTDTGGIKTSTAGGYGDAIIRLDGSDYVTISGLHLKALNQGIEYGILTHKPDSINGCQNITISHCKIEMNKGTSAM